MTSENPAAVRPAAAGAAAVPSRGDAAARPAARRQEPPVPDAAARPGTTTWIVEFPPGTAVLTANDRRHKYAQAARVKEFRQAAAERIRLVHRIPPLAHADVVLEYQPPPRRRADRHPLASARVEDSDALFPTRKAFVDALGDAGVLPHGDSRHRVGDAVCRLLDGTHPRGLLRIIVTGEPR